MLLENMKQRSSKETHGAQLCSKYAGKLQRKLDIYDTSILYGQMDLQVA